MACGLAANYPQLVVARMTVGFGEAGGVPPSYAIISDYFPPGRRGTALGIYNLGPPIGAALGVAFGASIAAAFSWRYAFIVLGAVGIVAALRGDRCIVREPRRGGLDRRPTRRAAATSRASGQRSRCSFRGRPCARGTRQRRDAVHHLRRGQFHDALPHAREGHDARTKSPSITRSSSASA